MKKTLLTMALLSAALPATAGETLDTFEKKFSYMVGVDMVINARNKGFQLDPDAVLQGMRDQMAGKSLKLTDADIEALMEEAQRRTEAYQKAQLEKLAQENREKEKRFFAENARKPGIQSLPEGIQYRIIEAGKGPLPKPGQYLVVHYEGRLLDGTVFDSSYRRGAPIRIQPEDVIKGWRIVLAKMRVGDKWEVFIPAALAYGENGIQGIIGPNEPLIFTMELLNVESPDTDEE